MASSLTSLNGARIPSVFAGRRSTMLEAARAGVNAGFAVVAFRGRAWAIKHRGEEKLVTDARGQPMPSLDVVIVGVAPSVSKTFYANAYVSGDDNAPDCFSLDGVAPDASAPRKQNDICGTCPNNQWGSVITQAGKRAKACQDNRRLAVVPLHDIENRTYGGPMMLRLPPTSLANLASYSAQLERSGVDFPYVATRLAFDYNVAYPKLTFEPIAMLDDEQAGQVVQAMEDPLISRMLNEAPGTKPPAAAPAPVPPPAPKVVNFQPPAPPPVNQDEPEEQPAAPPATPNPFMAATAAPPAAPETSTVTATPAPAPRGRPRKIAAAPPPTIAPPDLAGAIDDLLEEGSAA